MTVAAPETKVESKPARAKVSPLVRRPAHLWYLILVFLILALAGNVLVVLLAQGPANWWSSIESQFNEVVTVVTAYPLSSAGVALALVGLTFLGAVENARIAREDEARKAQETQQLVDDAAAKHVAPVVGRVGAVEEQAAATAAQVQQIAATLTAAPAPNVAAPGGLPRPLSLVGRGVELARLTESLTGGAPTGVFAVEGMGGVGKSALAAEAVARLSDDKQAFPGGAAWISCEGLEGAEGLAEIWSRVARALALDAVAAQADPEARRAALAQSFAARPRTLLALDNVEPKLDADALLDTLAITGHTALLLTAREAVAPDRLTSLPLAPLPDPDAVTLFAQRLRQADETRPTSDDETTIPALVEAVGGLPLAIELTAAYAGVQRLPLTAVKAELDADGLNAAAYRTNAKKAPVTRFDRSWRALTPSQRRFFAGLSLLAGASFPRPAALAIAKAAGDTNDERPDADALDDLATLVNYALVEALPGGDSLRLHPLLREYAELQLSRFPADISDRLGDAMVAYWLAYARPFSAKRFEGMAALEAEAAGLIGAIEWAHDHARHDEVLALAKALGFTWDMRGRSEEEVRIDAYAEEAARQSGDLVEQQWAADSRAITLGRLGRIDEARESYRRALELAKQLEDQSAERRETHGLASLDAQQGRIAEARTGYEQGLARQLGDRSAERAETHGLAVLDARTGRIEEARAGYEQALALARQLGDPSAEATELRNFGAFLASNGDTHRGRQLIEESLAICERLGDTYRVAYCNWRLGELDGLEGKPQDAIAHYREALRRFAQLGSPDAENVRAALRRLGAED